MGTFGAPGHYVVYATHELPADGTSWPFDTEAACERLRDNYADYLTGRVVFDVE